MNHQKKYTVEDLLTLMARLREPDYGCPWDLAQSYQTIAPSTLEEAYEVVDAIEQGSREQLKEELGDLLFQVVFYSQLGKEDNDFTFDEVVSALTSKLLRRHPHVFPDGTLESRVDLTTLQQEPEERLQQIKTRWEETKKNERDHKGHESLLDDIPRALPATVRALKLQKRAASVQFDWPDTKAVFSALQAEIDELQTALHQGEPVAIEEEFGDVLFTLVNLSRHLKVEPETALRKANNKFERRFRHMETLASNASTDLSRESLEQLDAWWNAAKQQ